GRAMVPGLLTTLPTPGRWWYLPMLRGDDHCRRAHRRHRREPTLARGQHTRPSLKKPPRFEGKLSGALGWHRGEQLWPYPGRVFAVGPAHTFADLARAIDNAFARWDLSHLSVFTLTDGRLVTDAATGAELATSAFGVMPTAALDIEVAKVMQTVKEGAQFRYVFDLGDDWTHCCTVDAGHIDPADVLGVIPPAPMAYWGWGTIPDQYDRGWAEDDGEGRAPSRPR